AAATQAEGQGDGLTRERDELQSALTDAQERVDTLETTLESSKAAFADLETQKQSLEDRLSSLDTELSNSSAFTAETKAAVVQAQEERDSALAERDSVSHALTTAEERVTALQAELEGLKVLFGLIWYYTGV
ncbi:hypothetical protein SARC_15510, partial [Sphaeroforma arctica JP610]